MRLIKLHRNFLINKISAILIAIVIIIGLLINIIGIITLNKEYNWFECNISFIEYLNTNILYYKLVVINLITYIWGSSFLKHSDSYHLLITGYKNIKFKYIISKMIILVLITIAIILCNAYLMSLIAVTCGNFNYSFKIIIEVFINLLLICLIYGLLSSAFSMLFNHQYSFFIAVGLFVLGELIKDGGNEVEVFFVFFPIINNVMEESFNFGVFHLIILFIIYFIVVLFGYLYKK